MAEQQESRVRAAMSPKALVPLVAGLCIGGLALKLGFDYVQRAKGAPTETVTVWAAAHDIPRGMGITDELLVPVDFPAKSVPPGAFVKKDELIGRVPRMTAPAGLPVTKGVLSPPGTPVGLPVPQGLRAVAVEIDEGSGVSHHLQPGSRVDVVGYFNVRSRGKNETIARTIIENVEVGAVGSRISAATEDEDEDSNRRKRPARAVTLYLKPEDVPQLHLAEQRGKIKLSLRNQQDSIQLDNDDMVSESYVVHGQKPQEEQGQNSFLKSFVTGMARQMQHQQQSAMASLQAQPESEPEPEPQEPQVAWTMKITNGNQVQMIGWPALDSMEPLWVMTAAGSQAASPPDKSGAATGADAQQDPASDSKRPWVEGEPASVVAQADEADKTDTESSTSPTQQPAGS